MLAFKEHYIVDENGNRIGVVLDIADYRKLLEELEELESIRAYDAAKGSGDEAIPFEQAGLRSSRIADELRRICLGLIEKSLHVTPSNLSSG